MNKLDKYFSDDLESNSDNAENTRDEDEQRVDREYNDMCNSIRESVQGKNLDVSKMLCMRALYNRWLRGNMDSCFVYTIKCAYENDTVLSNMLRAFHDVDRSKRIALEESIRALAYADSKDNRLKIAVACIDECNKIVKIRLAFKFRDTSRFDDNVHNAQFAYNAATALKNFLCADSNFLQFESEMVDFCNGMQAINNIRTGCSHVEYYRAARASSNISAYRIHVHKVLPIWYSTSQYMEAFKKVLDNFITKNTAYVDQHVNNTLKHNPDVVCADGGVYWDDALYYMLINDFAYGCETNISLPFIPECEIATFMRKMRAGAAVARKAYLRDIKALPIDGWQEYICVLRFTATRSVFRFAYNARRVICALDKNLLYECISDIQTCDYVERMLMKECGVSYATFNVDTMDFNTNTCDKYKKNDFRVLFIRLCFYADGIECAHKYILNFMPVVQRVIAEKLEVPHTTMQVENEPFLWNNADDVNDIGDDLFTCRYVFAKNDLGALRVSSIGESNRDNLGGPFINYSDIDMLSLK